MYTEEINEQINQLEFVPVGNKAKNLTNQKFGRWTVLGRAPHPGRAAYWWCICDCPAHTIKQVCGSHLTCNQSNSCGCLNKEVVSAIGKKAKHDLTNQKFGHLTAIKDSGQRGHNRTVIWLCQCDCGNQIFARSDELTTGHTQSCGCIKQSRGEEKIENILKSYNIEYQKEYSFHDLKSGRGGSLRFDFAIFQNKQLAMLIEFDGEQHFHEAKGVFATTPLAERQQNDTMKNEYCKKHGIKLVRIPYYEIGNLNLQKLELENIVGS